MSSLTPPFIDLAVDGRISPAQIDDFVDRWHEDHGGRHLHDFLGLTRAEYALWLVEPDMLGTIVKARAEGRPLPELVSDILGHCGIGGASADAACAERLAHWLAHSAPD